MNKSTVVREIATAFHEEYEARALTHGWQTNPLTRVAFDDLPIENQTLMCSVISALIRRRIIAIGDGAIEQLNESERVAARKAT